LNKSRNSKSTFRRVLKQSAILLGALFLILYFLAESKRVCSAPSNDSDIAYYKELQGEIHQKHCLDLIEACTKDTLQHPNSAYTYCARGWTYLALGKCDDAIADLRKASYLDPRYSPDLLRASNRVEQIRKGFDGKQ